jgi:ankyrin repeat protein/Ran GTPase-activating protein (RanGAP) involved in mRNA processing and transport
VPKSSTNKDVENSLKKEAPWNWVKEEQLDLSLKQLNNNCILQDLAKILKTNTLITEINLTQGYSTGGHILKANAPPIPATVAQHPSFKGDTNTEALGVIWVCLARNTLLKDKTLTCLDLKDRHIGIIATKILAEALKTDTTLKELNLTGNSIGIKGAQALAKALETNTNLTHLGLCGNGINYQGALALAEALKSNTNLTHLDLSHNPIGSFVLYINQCVISGKDTLYKEREKVSTVGVGSLANMLLYNHTLRTLNLNSTLTSGVEVEYLAQALKENTTLKRLSLSNNFIDLNFNPQGIQPLIEALKINTTLEYLDFQGNPVGKDQVDTLQAAVMRNVLLNNSTQTFLDLRNKGIGAMGIGAIQASIVEKSLQKNRNATELDLSNRHIGFSGLQVLITTLKTNALFARIDLTGNHLGAEGASLLAETLTTNNTLTQLHLADNDLGPQGLQALAYSLTRTQTLTQLNLAQNALGATGTEIIAQTLVTNTTLTELDLSANQLKLDLLITALQDNYTLKALHLQNNGLSDVGTERLARALAHHLSLTHLNLRDNGIGEAGAIALAQLLSQDTCSLKRLDLSENPLALTGITALAQSLQNNTTLMTLELNDNKIDVARAKKPKDPAALMLIEELKGYLERNLHLRHQAIQSHWERGQQCTDQNRYFEAIVHYHQVLRLDPEHPAINALRQAQAAFYLASPSLTTELLLAAVRGKLKRVQALVHQGVALSSQDELGHTVLWSAAANGKELVTRWLLTQVAPLLGLGIQFSKPVAHTLAMALKTTQASGFDLIEACQAAQQQQEQSLRILTGQTSPLYRTTGYTALHIAAWVGQTTLVRSLLQRDKSVSSTLHETQQTPLHMAIQAGHVDTANALIQYGGAPLDVADKTGQTPLDLIQKSTHNSHNKWVEKTKYLVHAYQQEQRLQQLMAERLAKAQAVRQEQAKTFAKEAEALRQELLIASTEDAFGVLRQAAWRAFRQEKSALSAQDAETCQQQLQQLEPPVILLNFNGYTLAEKAKFLIPGSPNRHPVFARLSKRRKTLKALNKKLTAAGAWALAAALTGISAYYKAYIEEACQTTLDNKGKQLSERFMVLYAAVLPPRLLRSEAQSLFAEAALQNREASDTAYGTSLVRSFQGIHFKRNPYAPGVEFMVSTLGQLLFGRGITPSELIKVLDTRGFSLPYLASRTVVGVELGHIIREHPDYLDHLRMDNFSAMVVLSLLIDPQDGKPDNYMAEMQIAGQLTSIEIIGIDNDIAFGEPRIYRHTTGDYQGKPFVTVKNVLYFFPQMAAPLDTTLRKSLLELEPAVLLLTWLQALQDKNQHYQQLLEEGVFTTEEFRGGKTRGMHLPIRLRPGTVTRLYQKLCALQAHLNEHPEATHQALFQALEPDLFQHYQAIQTEHHHDIMHCLGQLYLQAQPTSQARRYLASQLRSQQTAALTHSVLESAELKILEAQQTQPIEKAVAELLALLDYEHFNAKSLALLDEQLQKLKLPGVSDSCDPLALYRYMLEQGYCSEAFLKHLLTQRGLPPQSTYPGGDTPLHLAIQYGQQAIALMLLKYGVDVNKTNDAGYSPLHVAASLNDLPMVELLLLKKADKEKMQTKTGHTPLDKALSKGHEALAQWLLEQGATVYLPLYKEKVAALHQLSKIPVAVASPPSSSTTMSTATLLTRYSLLTQDSRSSLLSDDAVATKESKNLFKVI